MSVTGLTRGRGLVVMLVITLLTLEGCGEQPPPVRETGSDIPALMAEYHVPGVSIAIIKDFRDLAKLLVELELAELGRSQTVLNQETADLMLTRLVDGGTGLGVRLWDLNGQPYFGHDGENRGFVSIMQGLKGAGVGAVIMTNGDNGTAVAKKVIEIIAAEDRWPGFR